EHHAKRAFEKQAPNSACHQGGLVELVADFDVVRQNGLEARQVGFDCLDDRERRGVRSFGYGDVYGPASIHERITGLNVGAVLDRSDVANEDRPRSLRADRNVAQALDIPDDGVDRHQKSPAYPALLPRTTA